MLIELGLSVVWGVVAAAAVFIIPGATELLFKANPAEYVIWWFVGPFALISGLVIAPMILVLYRLETPMVVGLVAILMAHLISVEPTYLAFASMGGGASPEIFVRTFFPVLSAFVVALLWICLPLFGSRSLRGKRILTHRSAYPSDEARRWDRPVFAVVLAAMFIALPLVIAAVWSSYWLLTRVIPAE